MTKALAIRQCFCVRPIRGSEASLIALAIERFPGEHPQVLATPMDGNKSHAGLRVPLSRIKYAAQKAWQREFAVTCSSLILPEDPPKDGELKA